MAESRVHAGRLLARRYTGLPAVTCIRIGTKAADLGVLHGPRARHSLQRPGNLPLIEPSQRRARAALLRYCFPTQSHWTTAQVFCCRKLPACGASWFVPVRRSRRSDHRRLRLPIKRNKMLRNVEDFSLDTEFQELTLLLRFANRVPSSTFLVWLRESTDFSGYSGFSGPLSREPKFSHCPARFSLFPLRGHFVTCRTL